MCAFFTQLYVLQMTVSGLVWGIVYSVRHHMFRRKQRINDVIYCLVRMLISYTDIETCNDCYNFWCVHNVYTSSTYTIWLTNDIARNVLAEYMIHSKNFAWL